MPLSIKCDECKSDWDMDNPHVFHDHGNKHKLFIYFRCSNPICTRILYTELFVWNEDHLWISADLIIENKPISKIVKDGVTQINDRTGT
jgi:hypothetical protein